MGPTTSGDDGSPSTVGGTTAADSSSSADATTDGSNTSGEGDSTSANDSSTSGSDEPVQCPPGPHDTTLLGTVWTPNGKIPVSGALVYTSQDVPPGIPQHVYCADCEQLECDDVYTVTKPDGSFSLATNAQEANYLVVQKGQFMRISPLSGLSGVVVLSDTDTRLPAVNDPKSGLFTPRIAVADGYFDRLEDTLGKAGLGKTVIAGFEEHLVPGTEPFDLWENGRDPEVDGFVSRGPFTDLVSDPALLAEYHMILIPCSLDTHNQVLDPKVIKNIRDWVAAGGRWYVADWSNEWLEHVFPEYQTLQGEPHAADLAEPYDSLARIVDDDLLAWLKALPKPLKDINPLNDEPHPTLLKLPKLQTIDNYSAILQVHPVPVDDGMGGTIDVGHKVWLEGPGGTDADDHPLTVTGQFGCGKIQLTSYHAAEFFDYVGLSPQELVLLYTILEIGVCQDSTAVQTYAAPAR